MTSVKQALQLLFKAIPRAIQYRASKLRNRYEDRKVRRQDPEKAKWLAHWNEKTQEHIRSLKSGIHDYKYFEMLRAHAQDLTWYQYKVLPFFFYPVMLQAKNIVELGTSFSLYPEHYGQKGAWGLSSLEYEGLISTRIFLTACRFLNRFGIPARLTSVDVRENPYFDRAKQLLTQLDLLQYWNPVWGTDSVQWLKEQKETIDVALVDSQHTYQQVTKELENLAPLMSPRGMILIDDVYVYYCAPHSSWAPDDTFEDLKKGGQYGAVQEFLSNHQEWHAEWDITNAAYLYRKG